MLWIKCVNCGNFVPVRSGVGVSFQALDSEGKMEKELYYFELCKPCVEELVLIGKKTYGWKSKV